MIKRITACWLALMALCWAGPGFSPTPAAAGAALTKDEQRQQNEQTLGIVYQDSDYTVPLMRGTGYHIDLWNELLVETLTGDNRATYFYNGNRWMPIAFRNINGVNAFDISRYLNKGGKFLLCSEYDKIVKSPTANATFWEFEMIWKRERFVRPRLDYWTYADLSGATNGKWTLDYDTSTLTLALLGSDKRTEDNAGWGLFPADDGLLVQDLNESGRQTTRYFMVKTKPIVRSGHIQPASKPVKIPVKGVRKAPNCKIDYNREVIRINSNIILGHGDETNGSYVFRCATDQRLGKNGLPKLLANGSDERFVKLVTKEAYLLPATGLYEEESYFGQTMLARFPVLEQKPRLPASAVQVIHVAQRPMIDLSFANDCVVHSPRSHERETICNYKFNKKKYEALNESGWGNLPPTGTQVYIRKKNTAKYRHDGSTTGQPASLPLFCYINRYDGSSGSTRYHGNNNTNCIDIQVRQSPMYPEVPTLAFPGGGPLYPHKEIEYDGTPLSMDFVVGNLAITQNGVPAYATLYTPGTPGFPATPDDILAEPYIEGTGNPSDYTLTCVLTPSGDSTLVSVTMTYTGQAPFPPGVVKLRLKRNGTDPIEGFYSIGYQMIEKKP